MNWTIIIIFGVVVLTLLVYAIVQSLKGKKDFD